MKGQTLLYGETTRKRRYLGKVGDVQYREVDGREWQGQGEWKGVGRGKVKGQNLLYGRTKRKEENERKVGGVGYGVQGGQGR